MRNEARALAEASSGRTLRCSKGFDFYSDEFCSQYIGKPLGDSDQGANMRGHPFNGSICQCRTCSQET